MKYQTSKEWLEAAKYRTRQFCEGLWGLIYSVIILGVASLVGYAASEVLAFYSREKVAGAIVSVLLALVLLGWLYTFVSERADVVKFEHRADSLSYELSKYTQFDDGTERFIIDGDTITVRNYYPTNNE